MRTWNHELYHYGLSHENSKTGRGSGRYPWDPKLHEDKYVKLVDNQIKKKQEKGFSEKEASYKVIDTNKKVITGGRLYNLTTFTIGTGKSAQIFLDYIKPRVKDAVTAISKMTTSEKYASIGVAMSKMPIKDMERCVQAKMLMDVLAKNSTAVLGVAGSIAFMASTTIATELLYKSKQKKLSQLEEEYKASQEIIDKHIERR